MLLTTVEQAARLNNRQWRRERASKRCQIRLPIVAGTAPRLVEAVNSHCLFESRRHGRVVAFVAVAAARLLVRTVSESPRL